MQAAEGKVGRVFVTRLEDGDELPSCLERFAEEKQIRNGFVLLVGDIGCGEIVVGPRKTNEMPPDPMLVPVDGAHETLGVGIIAPDDKGKAILHIHASLGRGGRTVTGCLRPGVTTWLVAEAIIYEITGADARRYMDPKSGFTLLKVQA